MKQLLIYYFFWFGLMALIIACSVSKDEFVQQKMALGTAPNILTSVKKDSLWGFIDSNNSLVIAYQFRDMQPYRFFPQFFEEMCMVVDGKTDKAGIINNKGDWLFKPTYKSLYAINNNTILGRDFDNQEVRLNSSLDLIKWNYESVGIFDEKGYAYASKDGLYGCIDRDGNILIPFQSYDPIAFTEELAGVDIGREVDNHGDRIEKYGFIDRSGKMLIPAIYDFAFSFENGYAIVTKDYKDAIIDKNGQLLTAFAFDIPISSYTGFRSGVEFAKNLDASVHKSSQFGLINLNGEWLVKPQFDEVSPFSEGVAVVAINNKWGLIDTIGQWIIPPDFESLNDFKDNLALAQKNGLYGFINKSGDWVIDNEFELAYPFRLGFAGVKKNGKWGFINQKGDVVIDYQYKAVGVFHHITQKWKSGREVTYYLDVGK